ncbi:MAG: hypothetical protein WKF97_10120 [Chitinophagaceae bacterium]
MQSKKDIEREVEKTLNSLEGMRPATPGPFFFTRLQSHLHKAELNIWERISVFIARPTIAMAVVLAVVLMNTVVFFKHDETAPSIAEQQTEQQYEDFSLADNAFYDYENLEP